MENKVCWKKVLEQDLEYISDEMKEILEGKSCIILSGEVGAGKTTFIQNFMKNTSGQDVLSPTYSIINEQEGFAHADFYRIDDVEEIVHLEMGLYAEGKNYFLVEWGLPYLKEIKSQLGDQFMYYELKIDVIDDESGSSGTRNLYLRKLD